MSHSTPAGLELDVLLLDAQYKQTLAAMRAYARTGLRVGAAACEADAVRAPTLRSRWCLVRAALPNVSTNRDAYVDAILELLDRHHPKMLLPAHDASIEALRARRMEIERKTALPLASEAALDIAVNKSRTLKLARDLGVLVPRGVSVTAVADVPAALKEIGFPLVVKPYESWVQQPGGQGIRFGAAAFQSSDAAVRRLEEILSAGGQALVQQWLPGRREAVSVFYACGQIWARLAQMSYREWPVVGGASVMCETIPLSADISTPSEQLARAMDLEGCSMFEFRRDQHGRPVLMEVNPGLGGSVGLAIAAGVNFPQLMYDWQLTGALSVSDSYRVGLRLRWLEGDLLNIKSVFTNQGQPDVPPRGRALAEFLHDCVWFGNRVNVLDLEDVVPDMTEMDNAILRQPLGLARRLLFPSQATRIAA
jgi:predicted ATP-grasp superfamily ATP-dependent carboligase